MAQWEFYLTNLAGKVLWPLNNVSERVVTLPLQRIPTCSFNMRASDPAYDDILAMDRLVKCYRTGVDGVRRLVFHGPLLSVEENGSAGVRGLQVNAVGSMWRLQHRMVGKSVSGTTYSGSNFTSIALQILNATNTEGFSGVDYGTIVGSPIISGLKVGPIVFKSVLDAIAEMGAAAEGYEFAVTPVEPTVPGPNGFATSSLPMIGALDLVHPRIGADKMGAVFEFGTTKGNVRSFKRTYSFDGILTRGYTILNNSSVLTYEDGSASATRGAYESLVPMDLQDATSAQSLLNEHVFIRKDPRLLITFEPFRDARPDPVSEVAVGDTVRFRLVDSGTQVLRFDVNLRVYGITLSLDSSGSETANYELIQP